MTRGSGTHQWLTDVVPLDADAPSGSSGRPLQRPGRQRRRKSPEFAPRRRGCCCMITASRQATPQARSLLLGTPCDPARSKALAVEGI